jgi:hypothetical protein
LFRQAGLRGFVTTVFVKYLHYVRLTYPNAVVSIYAMMNIPPKGKGDGIMKNVLISLLVTAVLASAVIAFADKGLPVYKQGDAVFVCGCGEACDCKTMSRKEGKCTCNKPLVKGEITSMEGDKAMVKLAGGELPFTTKAKFTCDCGEACKCGTISQKPGKCTCGKEMKKVE